VPEVRDDLLRCAGFKHVVIAEEGALDVGGLKTRVSTPIHVLTLSTVQSVPEGILVNCRRVQKQRQQGAGGNAAGEAKKSPGCQSHHHYGPC
jgi:hypothetical protein